MTAALWVRMKTFLLALTVFAVPAMAQSKDLRNAYLFEASLQSADLQGADLSKCQLGHADLRNADLRNANLTGAYLFKTDLRGADLRGAKFATALKGAELKKTLLAGAQFDETTELPFSAAEALSRGMVQVPQTAVATQL
jgi:uncharacterized protein YjbI with pentapeptide repeats